MESLVKIDKAEGALGMTQQALVKWDSNNGKLPAVRCSRGGTGHHCLANIKGYQASEIPRAYQKNGSKAPSWVFPPLVS